MIVKCRLEAGTLLAIDELRVVVRAKLAGDHVVGDVCRWVGVEVFQRRGAVTVRLGEPTVSLDVKGLYRLLVSVPLERAVPWVRPPGDTVDVGDAWLKVGRSGDPREVYLSLDVPRRGLLPAFGVEVTVEPGVAVIVNAASPEALARLKRVVEGLRLLAAVVA